VPVCLKAMVPRLSRCSCFPASRNDSCVTDVTPRWNDFKETGRNQARGEPTRSKPSIFSENPGWDQA